MFDIGFEHVGGCLEDFPQRAAGAFVVDAAPFVRVQLIQHAEAHQARKFVRCITLKEYLARRLRLKEDRLFAPDYPQGQGQSSAPTEQFPAHLAYVHRRVLCLTYFLLSRI